jgi:hypothetical protein
MTCETTGECRICRKKNVTIHHFDFYAFGSEGVWMCECCRASVAECIRAMSSAASRASLQVVHDRKAMEVSR